MSGILELDRYWRFFAAFLNLHFEQQFNTIKPDFELLKRFAEGDVGVSLSASARPRKRLTRTPRLACSMRQYWKQATSICLLPHKPHDQELDDPPLTLTVSAASLKIIAFQEFHLRSVKNSRRQLPLSRQVRLCHIPILSRHGREQ